MYSEVNKIKMKINSINWFIVTNTMYQEKKYNIYR